MNRRAMLARLGAALAVVAGLPRLVRADGPDDLFSYDSRWIRVNGQWRQVIARTNTTVTVANGDWRVPPHTPNLNAFIREQHRLALERNRREVARMMGVDA